MRRLFQWHLSTCILLMFVAGGLMYVNSRLRYVLVEAKPGRWRLPDGTKTYSISRGWPVPGVTYMEVTDALIGDGISSWAGDDSVFYRPKTPPFRMTDLNPNEAKWTFARAPEWSIQNCVIDVIFVMTLLFTIARILEYAFRRREARTP